MRQNRYSRTSNRPTLSPSTRRKCSRLASSRKISRRSLPRAVTWYTAPSYSIRCVLAIRQFYSPQRLSASISTPFRLVSMPDPLTTPSTHPSVPPPAFLLLSGLFQCLTPWPPVSRSDRHARQEWRQALLQQEVARIWAENVVDMVSHLYFRKRRGSFRGFHIDTRIIPELVLR